MRLLLHHAADRAVFDAALLALELELVNVLPATATSSRTVVAAAPDGISLVSYVEDHQLHARYLEIRAHDPEPLAQALRSKMPFVSEEELRNTVATTPSFRGRALELIAVVLGALARPELEAALSDSALAPHARTGLAWLENAAT